MSAYDFIFSDARKHRIARHTCFWVMWLFFFASIYGHKWTLDYSVWRSYTISLIEAALFLPVHIIFSYLLIYFIIPRFLFTSRYLLLVLTVAGGSLLAAFASYLISEFINSPVRVAMGFEPYYSNLAFGLMAGLRGGLTVGGFAAAIKLMKYWYIKKEENEQLEKLNLQSELQLLKQQLHPHFLFNTLNNIYSFSRGGKTETPDMILRLSDMLHYMLYEGEQAWVPVQEELKLLQNYIALEQARYGERLDLYVNIEEDSSVCKIAPLILLPFVENAFKHGVSRIHDHPWLTVQVKVQEESLELMVVNGKPLTCGSLSTGGIGLQNVKQRLLLLYAGKHRLTILDDLDAYTVKLTLQLQSAGEHVTASSSPESAVVPQIALSW